MISFLQAHGMDAGPLQRPLLVGSISGILAAAPAIAILDVFQSLHVVADLMLQVPRGAAASLLGLAFTAAGASYGLVFRRAANDKSGGWLFGAAYGFMLWILAPVVVLPIIGASLMAAGLAAQGFFAAFLIWGTVIGGLFPHIHGLFQAPLGSIRRAWWSLGPSAAALRHSVFSRLFRDWR